MDSSRTGFKNTVGGSQNGATQVTVNGGIEHRPDHIREVAAVFGNPYQVDGKTLIPVARVRRFVTDYKHHGDGCVGRGLSTTRPVATIEVDAGRVRIVHRTGSPAFIIAMLTLAAWSAYWAIRTARELTARR